MPSTTQRFFVEGELQEKRQWKDSPLLLDEPMEPEAMEYTSFDRVPRRWAPLAMASMLVGLVTMGGAMAMGLWTPPAPWIEWARQFEHRLPRMRAAQTPTGTVNPPVSAPPVSAPPASAPLVSDTPGQSPPALAEPVAATPSLAASPSVAEVPPVVRAGGVESRSVGAMIPARILPEAGVVSAPAATVEPERHASSRALSPEPSAARPEPARSATERAHGRGNGLRGYVWSPRFGALVPVTSGAAPESSASWKPASPAAPISAAPEAPASSKPASPPAPISAVPERPPASARSATEPPPLPVAPIQPPKALPEPTEMAAPSAK